MSLSPWPTIQHRNHPSNQAAPLTTPPHTHSFTIDLRTKSALWSTDLDYISTPIKQEKSNQLIISIFDINPNQIKWCKLDCWQIFFSFLQLSPLTIRGRSRELFAKKRIFLKVFAIEEIFFDKLSRSNEVDSLLVIDIIFLLNFNYDFMILICFALFLVDDWGNDADNDGGFAREMIHMFVCESFSSASCFALSSQDVLVLACVKFLPISGDLCNSRWYFTCSVSIRTFSLCLCVCMLVSCHSNFPKALGNSRPHWIMLNHEIHVILACTLNKSKCEYSWYDHHWLVLIFHNYLISVSRIVCEIDEHR